jgi:hypothetical protein
MLELADVLITPAPYSLGYKAVNPDNQNVLIMTAVKDRQLTLSRDLLVDSP